MQARYILVSSITCCGDGTMGHGDCLLVCHSTRLEHAWGVRNQWMADSENILREIGIGSRRYINDGNVRQNRHDLPRRLAHGGRLPEGERP